MSASVYFLIFITFKMSAQLWYRQSKAISEQPAENSIGNSREICPVGLAKDRGLKERKILHLNLKEKKLRWTELFR